VLHLLNQTTSITNRKDSDTNNTVVTEDLPVMIYFNPSDKKTMHDFLDLKLHRYFARKWQ
jgi:hypothetical protein